MGNILLVAVGAAFGVVARAGISDWMRYRFRGSFPIGTFTVNMLGSFILGIVVGCGLDASITLVISVGFLGSFTTFSTFNVENIELLREKKYRHLFIYLGGSYTVGIMLVIAGIALGSVFETV
ncbi:MAG TPA: CrcB family protein [Virgibacillus sp.]|nr:CrcB family protein [Virgibacillus sp.]